MPEIVRCEECVFWDFKKDNAGFCKCRAPQPTVSVKDKEYILVWPSTLKDDGCGDGSKRS